jgi:cytochrome P450
VSQSQPTAGGPEPEGHGAPVRAVNPLSLPNDRDRYAIIAGAAGKPPYFDRRVGCWIVLDPAHVTELIADRRLVLPDVDAAITAVEERYNLKLDAMRAFARDIPLLIDGAHHQKVRGAMARFLSSRRRPAQESGAGIVAAIVERLSAGGRIDVFQALFRPAITEFFTNMTGVRVDFEPLSLTRIFDRHLTMRQLQAIEDGLGPLRAALEPVSTEEYPVSVMMGLVLLGRDSLLGSISDTAIALFEAHMNRRLDDPAIPAPRLNGAVAIAERTATEAISFAGAEIARGERVRLFYQGYNLLDGDTARMGAFGAGAHSCLGRPHSLDFWNALAAGLKSVPRTVRGLHYENDRSPIFYMPKTIQIELE